MKIPSVSHENQVSTAPVSHAMHQFHFDISNRLSSLCEENFENWKQFGSTRSPAAEILLIGLTKPWRVNSNLNISVLYRMYTIS